MIRDVSLTQSRCLIHKVATRAAGVSVQRGRLRADWRQRSDVAGVAAHAEVGVAPVLAVLGGLAAAADVFRSRSHPRWHHWLHDLLLLPVHKIWSGDNRDVMVGNKSTSDGGHIPLG